MKSEEKEQLRAEMEKKRGELVALVADLKEATKPQGLDSAVGRVSRMDYINNKSINESSLRKAQGDIKALDRWLSLYDTDKFAACSRCGNEINVKRLLLLPASSKCIHCAGR